MCECSAAQLEACLASGTLELPESVLSVAQTLGGAAVPMGPKLLETAAAVLERLAEALDTGHSSKPGESSAGQAAHWTPRAGNHGMMEEECVPRVLLTQPHIFVVWKPPGWTVTTSEVGTPYMQDAGVEEQSGHRIQDWLVEHMGHESTISTDSKAEHGLAHRLDRDTSGLLLCGRTYRGYYLALLAFACRAASKEYVCLCHGFLPVEPRVIEMQLPATPWRSLRKTEESGVVPGLRDACTEVLSVGHLHGPFGEEVSFVHLRLHTGRRHQIRAHMQSLGHPLVSDAQYGGETVEWCSRMFLHAYQLQVNIGDGPLRANCPLPRDLCAALAALSSHDESSRQLLTRCVGSSLRACRHT